MQLAELVPSVKLWARYIAARHKASLRQIEQESNANIYFMDTCLEIHSKTHANTLAAKLALSTFITSLVSSHSLASLTLSAPLHKYVIGKNGANINKIKSLFPTLLDIIIDTDDCIILVVSALPVDHISDYIVKTAHDAAEYTAIHLNIPHALHGKVIGAGGARLKEILAGTDAVTVKFPSTPSDQVMVKGPLKQVQVALSKINAAVAEIQQLDTENSFSIRVPVVDAIAKQIVGHAVFGKLLRELSAKFPDVQNVFVKTAIDGDFITVTGREPYVKAAVELIKLRVHEIEKSDCISCNIFDVISDSIKSDLTDDLRDRVLKRVIGRQGRGVKSLTSKHGVELYFEKEFTGNVTIKGLKAGVAALKKDLIQLVEHEVCIVCNADYSFAPYRASNPAVDYGYACWTEWSANYSFKEDS